MPDGTTFPRDFAAEAAAWIATPPALRLYACKGCGDRLHLSDFNDDMMCLACAGPDETEDPEYVIDASPEAMLRGHCTWSV